jgi:hypothetical protein
MSTLTKSTRDLYYDIRAELVNLHYRKLLINRLFTSQETNDLLNKAALRFFTTLKWDLFDTITIKISRMIDPAVSMKKFNNASLKQLISNIDSTTNLDLVNLLNDIHKQLEKETKRIVNWRNKWAGHRDFDVVQGLSPDPAISLPEIDKALSLIGKFLNEFEAVFQDNPVTYLFNGEYSDVEIEEKLVSQIHPPTPYEDRVFHPDDGDTIIELVKKALSSN